MVHILGTLLKDHFKVKYALTKFYGIGVNRSNQLCARFQIHDTCRVKELTPYQITAIASFLSSPSTAPALPQYPLAPPTFTPPPPNTASSDLLAKFKAQQANAPPLKMKNKEWRDPLKSLKVESDLRNEIRENIAHQRMIGSYVGRRHAMHLPVRGQNTQNNARTAKKLNTMERW
ncbi:hypothetical protein D9611_004898 [Ephemerocybe angulata]|uniref:Small ribosomal subunit protein uS13m n=2 Tax=Ephemerocybe angulata TaxID=980116 RepID=A0A8H6IGW1_9AGAR|nr:hypothetical protein D9611_004898 [Tulosesus angulatus]KAF6763932.1 hypothetical protein DFP72DRAFT_873785 [Tulosesus angulatus]